MHNLYHFRVKEKLILLFVLLFFPLLSFTVFGQKDSTVSQFKKESIEAQSLLGKNPDLAFQKITALLEQAKSLNEKEYELLLLKSQCQYFLIKADFNKLITASQLLSTKSKQYKEPISEAISYAYLSNAYALNGLTDDAETALNDGLRVLNKIKAVDDDVIKAKGRMYTDLANVAIVKNQPKQQLFYMHRAMEEHSKIRDETLKRRLNFRDLSNLAMTYYEFDIDSAEYYAARSIEVSTDRDINNDLMFNNYLVLGVFNKHKKNYSEAINFYKKAEEIEENKYLPNVEELYKRFVEIYSAIGDSSNSEKYQTKLNLLRLEVSQNKNESLHTIIENARNEDKSGTYRIILIGSIVLILTLLLFLLQFYRKNRTLAKQEKESQHFLQKNKSAQNNESIKELIDIISNNSPGFLFAFEKVFPDFVPKLLKLFPEASKIEIEFCALIKINLSTKEIAKYKSIHIRSVQNRKYQIRKKLNIPAENDIYDWFRDF